MISPGERTSRLMEQGISIFNDVIGPVMRGPSSSHTAGAYHLGRLGRALFGRPPRDVVVSFDPDGSYGRVYREQGADLAFAAGLMGWHLTDERFEGALAAAAAEGTAISFMLEPVAEDGHPNAVRIAFTGPGGEVLTCAGRSIGGGAVEVIFLNDWAVRFTGNSHEAAVEVEHGAEDTVVRLLCEDGAVLGDHECQTKGDRACVCARRSCPLTADVEERLRTMPGVLNLWIGVPLFFVKNGTSLFSSATALLAFADAEGLSLGETALKYEAHLLSLSDEDVLGEMGRRLGVMRAAVEKGLTAELPPMQLLEPSAGKIYAADAAGRLGYGGPHTRMAARAMAAMHVNCGMGVVCAAPTAGSVGVLPGVLVTLIKEYGIPDDLAIRSLLAAGLVGVIVATRATFAAEVAGCQVEIGAAGAMAAAAAVEAAGGTPRQAADAAAIAFQNTMGSVCDLVQGIVEIPCHTRNAVAASNAFVCADMVMGGYVNPVPLDETIDAVLAVGRMLPGELRCTALGGLAATPSARALPRRR